MPRDIVAHLPYLARDKLYESVKPFGADFPVHHFPGSELSNHVFDHQQVVFHDLRGGIPLDLNVNGSCVVKAKTSLTAHEATNERTPSLERYLREVEVALYENFAEYSRIEVMDFQVRKRSPAFPKQIGAPVDFAQPAAMPHTDFSVTGAFMRMAEAFPGQEHVYTKQSFDLLNVWRVLKGPNNDWPLALCDFQTVDLVNDFTTNDALHQKRQGENWLLYANSKHKWHYLSSQEEDELIIFRNTDSEGILPRCFHASFLNALATGEPRQSIEVRVVAFREKKE